MSYTRSNESVFNPADVWAEGGDAAAPSYPIDQGFPPQMSLPGGPAPERTTFNWLYRNITALSAALNQWGCFLPWNALCDYLIGSNVIGPDGKAYRALLISGPDSGGPATPGNAPLTWSLSEFTELGTMAIQNAVSVAITGGSITGTNINTALAALGTMSTQSANAVAITGGTINGTVIGGVAPAVATFTSATDSGATPATGATLTNRDYVDAAVADGGNVTGDVKLSYNTSQSVLWVPMNDGTIGSASSGATTYANAAAESLYSLLWNTIPNTWVPVTGGRGASASDDFTANKTMKLPAIVGRALCVSGTGTLSMAFTASGNVLTVPTTSSLYNGTPVTVSNTGGALPSPLVAATIYFVVNISGTTISLSETSADVNNVGGAPVLIVLSTIGSGINTITVDYSAFVPGQIVGEGATQLLVENEAAHTHTSASNMAGRPTGNNNIDNANDENPQPHGATGGNVPHNTMQPSSFIPVFIHI